MPIVTGTLHDFNLQPLAGFRPEIVFTASAPAVLNPRFFVTKPVVVTPSAAGTFTVELAATTLLRPEVWYAVSVRWLDPLGGYTTSDFTLWKVRVPPAGGNIADLVETAPTPQQTWIGPTPPAGGRTAYMWWIDTSSVPPVLNEWSN